MPRRRYTPPSRPPAPRHDGFSPGQQRVFLETLAAAASVRDAAHAAGISRNTAYRHRDDPRAIDFRAGWDTAIARAVGVLIDTAFGRAIDGVEEPVFHDGKQVGTRIRHDGQLPRFLIDRRFGFAPRAVRIALDGSHHSRELHTAGSLGDHVD